MKKTLAQVLGIADKNEKYYSFECRFIKPIGNKEREKYLNEWFEVLDYRTVETSEHNALMNMLYWCSVTVGDSIIGKAANDCYAFDTYDAETGDFIERIEFRVKA